MGHGCFGANGALGENICLALQLPFLVQNFQRTQQIIAVIIGKCPAVLLAVNQPKILLKGIIEVVQLRLFCLNFRFWTILGFQRNETADTIPKPNESTNALSCCFTELRRVHSAVLPVVNCSVHNGKAIVFHIGIGRDGILLLVLCFIHSYLHIGPADMLHGLVELLGQYRAGNGPNRAFLPSILGALGGEFSQHHLRVLHKIAVQRDTVLSLVQMHPLRFHGNHALSLLQEQNVRYYTGARIGKERIVGETNSS